MGAQPDTSTSAPEVWHGVPQILAPIFVARLLDTYLAGDADHQLASVLAAEQHAQRSRRLVQPFQDGQALAQQSLPVPSGEPGARFLIAGVISEDLEPLHPRLLRSKLTGVAQPVWLYGIDLRDPPAQHDPRAGTQMQQRGIQRGATDIVEIH